MEAIFPSETSALSEIHCDETQKTLLFMRYEVFIATNTYIVTFGFLLFSEIVASSFAWNMNCCEMNEWDGHEFAALANPVFSRQWRRRQSEVL